MNVTHIEHKHPLSHKVALGLGLSTAALSLAPYLLPWVGFGSATMLAEAENLIHPPTGSNGMGLAGAINHQLSLIPMIGTALATGIFFPLIASAAIGIGGVLLANWMEKNEKLHGYKPFSTVIRAASLVTSALISLPSILTGLSTGMAFIALTMGDMGQAVSMIQNTIGSVSGHAGSTGILSASIPHLLLCGASLVPVGAAYWLSSPAQNSANTPMPQINSSTHFDRVSPAITKPHIHALA